MSLHDFWKFHVTKVSISFSHKGLQFEIEKEIKNQNQYKSFTHTKSQVIIRNLVEYEKVEKSMSSFIFFFWTLLRDVISSQHEWINQIKTNCISLKAGQSNQQFVFYDSIVCFYND